MSVWLTDGDGRAWFATALLAYGAVILAFTGAVHWGPAMANEKTPGRAYLPSVLLALVGCCAIMLPPGAAAGLLILAFIAVYGLDRNAISRGVVPVWYPRLRFPLTVTVTVLMVVGGAALLVNP